ncbi:MAG: ABC-F family ATP-binding cassette domain-containing protein [Ruminococcaceae bacterium]|nr:ABC-F family ATP-binding cassette domain-containing protein [Oscillospiraceae bacterium]
MYFSINGAEVSYGGEVLLRDINIEIRDKEKIAVVGRNGCGKTTLLKLIYGDIEIEGGNAAYNKSKDTQIGYLKQISFDDLDISLDDELEKAFIKFDNIKNKMESLLILAEKGDNAAAAEYSTLEELYKNLGGYYYKKEKEAILTSFGFSAERNKPLKEFSGGQLTKISFMKLLLSKPDILLLDEPTNHLDLETVEWLENYLKSYPQAVVLVSHDQMFIDKVAETVYEIEYGKIRRYKGNYSDFVRIKKEENERQLKEYKQQKKEIQKTEELIERFRYKATKAAMVQSRIKSLDKTEIIEAPVQSDTRAFFADFTPEIQSGNNVMDVKNLKIGYSETLAEVSFNILRGDKVGIIGANGKGKSTLLKTLMGMLPAISGSIIQGVNLRIGYFDQHLAQYVSEKTVLDDYWDTFPALTQTQVRSDLGAFLFRGEDVFKSVSVLSGGEKVRLCLCKILKKKPNFLILDEPTNHMDIIGKQALEEMLKSYPGTILCVSHDRYFIKEVCDNLLVFDGNKTSFLNYGYAEYEENKATENKEVKEKTDTKNGTQKGKYYSAFKELSKVNKRIEKIEGEIEAKEIEIENLKNKLSLEENSTDFEKLSEISEEIETNENKLNEIYLEWEELCEKRDNLQRQQCL